MATVALTKRDDRQDVLSAEFVLNYNDFTTVTDDTHTLTGAFTLPANARVVGGEVVVDTAWAMATTGAALLDVGDGDSINRYGAAINLETAQSNALTVTGYKYPETDQIDLTVTYTIDVPTAGKLYLRIEYIVEGRAMEVQE